MYGELRVVMLSLETPRRWVWACEETGSEVGLALRASLLEGILTGARLKENFLFILAAVGNGECVEVVRRWCGGAVWCVGWSCDCEEERYGRSQSCGTRWLVVARQLVKLSKVGDLERWMPRGMMGDVCGGE